MNTFYLHGLIENLDEPRKNKNKSGLLLIKIGASLKKDRSPVQTVNKVYVRVPAYLEKRISEFSVGNSIEVKGRLQGIVKRDHAQKQYMHVELVAESIYATSVSGTAGIKNTISTFMICGVIKHVSHSVSTPGTMLVKYGPERVDRGRSFEYVNAIQIKAMAELNVKNKTLRCDDYVEILGHIRGVEKSVTEGESYLETELIAERVRLSHMLQNSALDQVYVA